MNVDPRAAESQHREYALLPSGKGDVTRHNLAVAWLIPAFFLLLFFLVCAVIGAMILGEDPASGGLWFFTGVANLGGIAVVMGSMLRCRSAIHGDQVHLATVRIARRLVTAYSLGLVVLFFVVPVAAVMAAPLSGPSGFADLFLWPVLFFAAAFVLTGRLALTKVLKRSS